MSFEAPMKMRWLSPKDKLAGSSQLKNPDIFGALYTLRMRWLSPNLGTPKDKLAGSSQRQGNKRRRMFINRGQLKNPDIFGALYTLRTQY